MNESTSSPELTESQKLQQALAELEAAKKAQAEQTRQAERLHHFQTHGEWRKDCPEHLLPQVKERLKGGLSYNQAVDATLEQVESDKRRANDHRAKYGMPPL